MKNIWFKVIKNDIAFKNVAKKYKIISGGNKNETAL